MPDGRIAMQLRTLFAEQKSRSDLWDQSSGDVLPASPLAVRLEPYIIHITVFTLPGLRVFANKLREELPGKVTQRLYYYCLTCESLTKARQAVVNCYLNAALRRRSH